MGVWSENITVTASRFLEVSFDLEVSLRQDLKSSYGPQLAAIFKVLCWREYFQSLRKTSVEYRSSDPVLGASQQQQMRNNCA